MKKYINKPASIEAAQWKGKFIKDAKEFVKEHDMPEFMLGMRNGVTGLIIETLEGERVAVRGDFIIRGAKGEYSTCNPDIFKATYYTEDEYAKLDS